jgi:RimJ/RimL family protein N-acetyltransferase
MTRGINLAPYKGVMFKEVERHVIGTMVPDGYPHTIGRDFQLENGESVRIRPIRPDDEPRLVTLYDRLSRRTAYQRFFAVKRRLPADWVHSFANVDYRSRLAIVAERETVAGIELVGVGRYEPTGEEGIGEVAFVLEDGYQGRGLGVVLLDEVLSAGIERGLTRFRADVLVENHRMLRLLAHRTHILERTVACGTVSILFEPN